MTFADAVGMIFFLVVCSAVVGFLCYLAGAEAGDERGKTRAEASYKQGYEDGFDAAKVDWHRRMFEADRRHEARLQAVIDVATRPDARVILPEMPNSE